MNNWIKKCRNLIVHDKIDEAIKLLLEVVQEDKDFVNQLILIQSRYYSLKQKYVSGIISLEEENITNNRIRSSLLGIIEDVRDNYEAKTILSNNKIEKKEGSDKLKVFVSYAHRDESYRKDLETYLSLLRRQNLIEIWTDRQILAGSSWAQEISNNLETADLVIPLISPDFIASDYCYEIEMTRAIEKHDNGSALIIPIIIRPCAWKNSPFVNFQALPFEGKPISTWNNKDEAWLSVYEGIANVCKSYIEQRKETEKSISISSFLEKEIIKKSPPYVIGIFGETGSGKSTLCNSILGKEVMRVSDITPATRSFEKTQIEINGSLIEIIDSPGIGESLEEDERIRKLYTKFFDEVDTIIWVLRADIRNYSCDQSFIEEIKQLDLDKKKRFIIALNMVDRLGGISDWNEEENRPSKNQLYLMDRKVMYVSGLFRIPPNKILPMSGLRKYNVNQCVKEILEDMKNKRNAADNKA